MRRETNVRRKTKREEGKGERGRISEKNGGRRAGQ